MNHAHPLFRRGSVLVVSMWIIIALTAVVLVLAREMVVEALATKQHLAQAKADAAEQGAEQFVLSVMAGELVTPGYRDAINMEEMSMGECYVWIVHPNVDDETQPAYGLTDEASKLDLNSATASMFEYLPNMDYNIAAAIVDWRDTDEDITTTQEGGQGAETNEYQMGGMAYQSKNAPFESVDELQLIYGMTDDLLWGADLNHNGIIEQGEADSSAGMALNSNSMLGLMAYCTVYGVQATNPPATTSSTGTTGATGTGGTTGTSTAQQPVNVNATNNTQLQQMLNQYLPSKAQAILTATQNRVSPPQQGGGGGRGGGGGGGGGATANPFKNLWDWAITMQRAPVNMTSADFQLIYPYLTCATSTTGTGAGGGTGTTGTTTSTTKVAKLNILTASEATLMCIPGFTQSDADAIISYRETNPPLDPTQVSNISWLLDVLPAETSQQATSQTTATLNWGNYVTGNSTVYSADIVTASQDGRAFKRVKIVVDSSSGVPQIVYRRDLTDFGWPLDPSIRQALRNGEVPGETRGSGGGMNVPAIGIR